MVHFQRQTCNKVLFVGHGLQHRQIGAEGACDGSEIGATPQAFDKGLAGGDAAAGEHPAIQIAVVNMHFGVGRCRVFGGAKYQCLDVFGKGQRTSLLFCQHLAHDGPRQAARLFLKKHWQLGDIFDAGFAHADPLFNALWTRRLR